MHEKDGVIYLSKRNDLQNGNMSPCVLLDCHACCLNSKFHKVIHSEYIDILNAHKEEYGDDFEFSDHEITGSRRIYPGRTIPLHSFSFDGKCIRLEPTEGMTLGCGDYDERFGPCRRLQPGSEDCNTFRSENDLQQIVIIS